jgi:hypothetical protein
VPRRALALGLAFACAACAKPDPQAVLEHSDLETYWAVDSAVGETQYIAPVLRLRLRNRSAEPQQAVRVRARFERKGHPGQDWGSAEWWSWGALHRPLKPGETVVVVLKSDGRYYSTGAPESMFGHELFRDARAELFAAVGPSDWIKLGEAEVERRIGSREVEALRPEASPEPGAARTR